MEASLLTEEGLVSGEVVTEKRPANVGGGGLVEVLAASN